MFTQDDLVDAIMEALGRSGASGSPAGVRSSPRPAGASGTQGTVPGAAENAPRRGGRVFLSEYELKKAVDWGKKELRVPSGAILSPLALDWIAFKRIRVVEV
ncbi:MAG: hypothetical protein A3G41_02760 [Elusimicrobia bacterium RIFCSPLOWO2_12_FULL_59_9]|nr:MAG: hypothetical protein A3G41_02760 [Elusimicrobia bacterium RIFCSPLOWO2_12_FULL_59_9]